MRLVEITGATFDDNGEHVYQYVDLDPERQYVVVLGVVDDEGNVTLATPGTVLEVDCGD